MNTKGSYLFLILLLILSIQAISTHYTTPNTHLNRLLQTQARGSIGLYRPEDAIQPPDKEKYKEECSSYEPKDFYITDEKYYKKSEEMAKYYPQFKDSFNEVLVKDNNKTFSEGMREQALPMLTSDLIAMFFLVLGIITLIFWLIRAFNCWKFTFIPKKDKIEEKRAKILKISMNGLNLATLALATIFLILWFIFMFIFVLQMGTVPCAIEHTNLDIKYGSGRDAEHFQVKNFSFVGIEGLKYLRDNIEGSFNRLNSLGVDFSALNSKGFTSKANSLKSDFDQFVLTHQTKSILSSDRSASLLNWIPTIIERFPRIFEQDYKTEIELVASTAIGLDAALVTLGQMRSNEGQKNSFISPLEILIKFLEETNKEYKDEHKEREDVFPLLKYQLIILYVTLLLLIIGLSVILGSCIDIIYTQTKKIRIPKLNKCCMISTSLLSIFCNLAALAFLVASISGANLCTVFSEVIDDPERMKEIAPDLYRYIWYCVFQQQKGGLERNLNDEEKQNLENLSTLFKSNYFIKKILKNLI